MDRRAFLELVGAGVACIGAAGCASLAAVSITPADGRIRLRLTEHPALSRAGGSLRLRPEGARGLLYVLALEGGGYAVVDPTCTHQGCTVDVEGVHLVCPCHGSTYDREGTVLVGPAPRSLVRLPAALDPEEEDVLVIDLGRGP